MLIFVGHRMSDPQTAYHAQVLMLQVQQGDLRPLKVIKDRVVFM